MSDSIPSSRIAELIAIHDRLDSAFARGLEQIMEGSSTISSAVDAVANGELALNQLPAALARGKAQLAVARSVLELAPDEPRLNAYIAADEWFADRIRERLADPTTDAAAIRREHEAFADHQPGSWLAVVGTIGVANKIRTVILGLKAGTAPDDAMRALLKQADAFVRLARDHIAPEDAPVGPRLEAHLEASARLLDQLVQALAGPE